MKEDLDLGLFCEIYDSNDVALIREHIFRTGSRIGGSRRELTGLATAISDTCRFFLRKCPKLAAHIIDDEQLSSRNIYIKLSATFENISQPVFLREVKSISTSVTHELINIKNYFDNFDLSIDDSRVINLTLEKRLS